MPDASLLTTVPSRAAGAFLGGVFQAVGAVRRSKPLHPKGAVLRGVLIRDGHTAAPTGATWVDIPGQDDVLVRLSRSVGLPARLPDIQGLAVRVLGTSGPSDLLLSTTGRGPLGRHVLQPRLHPGSGFYGTLLPYRAANRLVYLAAEMIGSRTLPADPALLVAAVGTRPAAFRLLVGEGTGPWRPFGHLQLTGRAAGDVDPGIDFDPVLNPLPGLELPGWLRRMREPAYAGARRSRSRGASPTIGTQAPGSSALTP